MAGVGQIAVVDGQILEPASRRSPRRCPTRTRPRAARAGCPALRVRWRRRSRASPAPDAPPAALRAVLSRRPLPCGAALTAVRDAGRGPRRPGRGVATRWRRRRRRGGRRRPGRPRSPRDCAAWVVARGSLPRSGRRRSTSRAAVVAAVACLPTAAVPGVLATRPSRRRGLAARAAVARPARRPSSRPSRGGRDSRGIRSSSDGHTRFGPSPGGVQRLGRRGAGRVSRCAHHRARTAAPQAPRAPAASVFWRRAHQPGRGAMPRVADRTGLPRRAGRTCPGTSAR